jgi:hypothetical protein
LSVVVGVDQHEPNHHNYGAQGGVDIHIILY